LEIYFYHISLSFLLFLSGLCVLNTLNTYLPIYCNAYNDETRDVWTGTFAVNRVQLVHVGLTTIFNFL
jgi:hypothetical protein